MNLAVDRYSFSVLTVMMTVFAGINGQMITVKPMPTGGTIGERAQMNCSIDTLGSDSLWWFRHDPGGTRDTIYTSPDTDVKPEYRYEFEIEIVDNIQYNLHFRNVQQGQEMEYGCELRNIVDHSFSAQFMTLTGADCNPKPNSGAPPITEGGYLVSSCSVWHYGAMTPKLEWFDENGNLVPSEPVEDEDNLEHMTITTNLTALAEHDEMEFECRLQFKQADGNGNIPIYHDHCLSAQQVFHAPTNMKIYPEPVGTITIVVGEEVNCTASARPLPVINWYSSDGAIYEGDTLVITEDMIVGEERTYECRATNVVNGQARSASMSITLYVESPEYPGQVPTYRILLISDWTSGESMEAHCVSQYSNELRKKTLKMAADLNDELDNALCATITTKDIRVSSASSSFSSVSNSGNVFVRFTITPQPNVALSAVLSCSSEIIERAKPHSAWGEPLLDPIQNCAHPVFETGLFYDGTHEWICVNTDDFADSSAIPSMYIDLEDIATTHDNSDLTPECALRYSGSLDDQASIMRSLLDSLVGNQLCSGVDSISEISSLTSFTSFGGSALIHVDFILSYDGNISGGEALSCSGDVLKFVKQYTNWGAPLLPPESGCPDMEFDGDTFDESRHGWICNV